MASNIILTFGTQTGDVSNETIDVTGNGQLSTFVPTRYKSGLVTINANIAKQVYEYYNAFQLDYNRDEKYNITYDSTTVTIEHPLNAHFDSFVDGTHNTTTFITTGTGVDARPDPILLEVLDYAANTSDFCDTTLGTFGFNRDVVSLKIEQSGVVLFEDASFNNSTKTLAVPRSSINVKVTAEASVYNTISPDYSEILDVDVNENSIGATVTIYANTFLHLTAHQYAIVTTLDEDPTFQASNIFTSVTEGDFYAVIKDNFNCIKYQSFSITTNENPFIIPKKFFISGKNSIRFANRATGLTSNPFNFLSWENPFAVKSSAMKNTYSKGQKFNIQFKSSYTNHTVQVINACGNNLVESEIFIVPQLRTDNINRNTYLEADISYSATLQRSVISFTPGNTYNSSGTVTGTHSYDGYLPAFYEEGTPLIINDNLAAVIIDTYTEAGVEYAVTNISSNIAASGVKVESIHTELPYETYDFQVNTSTIDFDLFFIRIIALKANNDTAQLYDSEVVEVIPEVDFVVSKWHIMDSWSESNDTELDAYPTPSFTDTNDLEWFSFLRNLEFHTPLVRISEADIDTQKLDNRETKIDFKSRKIYEMGLVEFPSEIAGNIADVFNEFEYHKIDGIIYTTISKADIEHKGQRAIVKVQLAVVDMSSEFGLVQQSLPGTGPANSFYPVVVG